MPALSVIVFGATGDLAHKKIVPALFALFCQGYLPDDFRIFGFARTALDNAGFRESLAMHLTCRYTPGKSCQDFTGRFLARCFYVPGDYGSVDSMLALHQAMRAAGEPTGADRLFYMAVPPFLFDDIVVSLGGAGLAACERERPWARVVIEKPFGEDRASSNALAARMARVFPEDRTYRIDHYLGKEMIQNLMVLRFANTVFEPLWNRQYVRRVEIVWQEDAGVGERGGYFDNYGIIRDVMQNHLLQILALTAMERPASSAAEHIRDRKVEVLRCVKPPAPGDFVTGQYAGYLGEEHVSPGSLTPTFAATVLRVDTPRWNGVPFLVTAGKALASRLSEVRIVFRDIPNDIFGSVAAGPIANRLVIRIQPDEAIRLRIVNKQPGLNLALAESELNLKYDSAFAVEIPDAYECLLLDALNGDKSLFIRADELAAAWDVFTPALHEMKRLGLRPEQYEAGSNGPARAAMLV